jgi:hypothetical protein
MAVLTMNLKMMGELDKAGLLEDTAYQAILNQPDLDQW